MLHRRSEVFIKASICWKSKINAGKPILIKKIIKQYKRVGYNIEQSESLQHKHGLFILNWMVKAQTQ